MTILSRYFKILGSMTRFVEYNSIDEQIAWWQAESARLIQLALQSHDTVALTQAWQYSSETSQTVLEIEPKVQEKVRLLFAEKYELALYEVIELYYLIASGQLIPPDSDVVGGYGQNSKFATIQLHNCIFWYLGRWGKKSEIEYVECMVEERIASEKEASIIQLT
jgi:hypothetical protein